MSRSIKFVNFIDPSEDGNWSPIERMAPPIYIYIHIYRHNAEEADPGSEQDRERAGERGKRKEIDR